MTYGGYPEVSLARDRLPSAKKLLAEGIDPMGQRKAVKTAQEAASVNSFASVAALFLDHWQEGKSARHVDSVRRRVAADILPKLGPRPIEAIKAPEVVAMIKGIEQRGAHDIAKRALETTGANLPVRRCARVRQAKSCRRNQAKRHPEIRPQGELRQNRRERASGPSQEN